jgi:topoisomerase IA-like protein
MRSTRQGRQDARIAKKEESATDGTSIHTGKEMQILILPRLIGVHPSPGGG